MHSRQPIFAVNRRGFLQGAIAAGSLASLAADGTAPEQPESTRLFLSERGRLLLLNNEEISRWRWARKRLQLPAAAAGAKADIWILLQMYKGNRIPLEVFLNGKLLAQIEPDDRLSSYMLWSRVEVPAGRLRQGTNVIELRSDAPAMNSWMLGIEPGHRDPQSFLSGDHGENWRNHDMGFNNVVRGEYVIRLRSHGEQLQDPVAPPIVYEDPSHQRVKESLELLPESIRNLTDAWKQIRSLRTWVAKSWAHQAKGPIYTPWDPWTILDWAKEDRGQGRQGTICMCVHFAALFAALATALGHRARCVVVTEDHDKPNGHFMAEVWDANLKQWVLHDPNYDVHYADGKPLSAIDLAQRSHLGKNFHDWVVAGEGMPKGPAALVDYFKDYFASGISFRMTGVWFQNQYVSDPTVAPPSHGSVSYCEPEIVWYNPPGMDLAPMFPYRVANREYFDKKP